METGLSVNPKISGSRARSAVQTALSPALRVRSVLAVLPISLLRKRSMAVCECASGLPQTRLCCPFTGTLSFRVSVLISQKHLLNSSKEAFGLKYVPAISAVWTLLQMCCPWQCFTGVRLRFVCHLGALWSFFTVKLLFGFTKKTSDSQRIFPARNAASSD